MTACERLELCVCRGFGPKGSLTLTKEMRKKAREQAEQMLGPCREVGIAFTMTYGMGTINITYERGEAGQECMVSVLADTTAKTVLMEAYANADEEICVSDILTARHDDDKKAEEADEEETRARIDNK